MGKNHVDWNKGNQEFDRLESTEEYPSKLKLIQEQLRSKRRTGSTTAIINLAKELKECILVTGDMDQFQQFLRHFGLLKDNNLKHQAGIRNFSFAHPGYNKTYLEDFNKPYLFDASFIHAVFNTAIEEINHYKNHYKGPYKRLSDAQINLSKVISDYFPSFKDNKYENGMVTNEAICNTAADILSRYQAHFTPTEEMLKISYKQVCEENNRLSLENNRLESELLKLRK